MNKTFFQPSQGTAVAIRRSLTVTDLCFCLLPIGLFLSIVSLV